MTHKPAPSLPPVEAQSLEKCDKCGTLVPRNMIAIEIEDGHPIDDPAGFQWCVVCHSQRVVAHFKARMEAAETELWRLRETPSIPHKVIADRIVNDWKANPDSSRGLDPLREAIGKALREAAQLQGSKVTCRFCDEEIRLIDGDWLDRETFSTCESEPGTSFKHEPKAESLPSPDGWQPISTAPKDGKELLLLMGGLEIARVDIGHWTGVERRRGLPDQWMWRYRRSQSPRFDKQHQPTHWMKVPTVDAPAPRGGTQEPK